jgi:hypothetical protein
VPLPKKLQDGLDSSISPVSRSEPIPKMLKERTTRSVHEHIRWVRSDFGTPALTRQVAALRCGLDGDAWEGDGASKCADLVGSPGRGPLRLTP